jgi:hypothetical protein|tara:strand:+ start:1737 stop:4202 length:2466 start_codon:yes stop_codon:yes gene_type:complete
MSSGNYRRSPVTSNKVYDSGPYEAVVVNHLDVRYMGGLEVELKRYTSSGNTPEAAGQLVQVRYLSPFYGITPGSGLTPNDGYQNTQKSYGMWMVPPDIGTRVLVVFAEGNLNLGYWIGCIPDDYMNFMVPDGRASTEQTTALTPDNIKGAKLPVGEYNKSFEDGALVDPTLFKKPYNKDFTEVLETQGLIFDENRGTTTTSARREAPSMVFGVSTPGPLDRRDGSPKVTVGPAEDKVNVPFNRLGGSSFVMDDGDASFIRKTHPEDGPPVYVNKMDRERGGKQTMPQNELLRFRTRTGHQLLMHNSEDLIYIGNARGTTWIEMTSDGKIDIHAQDSVSIMTDNDLNITAERDINLEAGRNINMKATARYSKGSEIDAKGLESGRIQIEAQHNHNLLVGKDSKITVSGNMHTGVNNNQHISTGKFLHVNTGQDNRLTAGGYTHIHSEKEHRETATYIHMNGPTAASASKADTVVPLETVQLPFVFPGSNKPVVYDSILTRAPQHEPWPHHENLDPQAFKKTETDREAPGSLATADRVLTPDTFASNKGGRKRSAVVTGSGGNIDAGFENNTGGTGTGSGTIPVDDYSSNFEFNEELGSLSSKYESKGNPTAIGYDSTGGWSYGTYQLATKTGGMKGYLAYLSRKYPGLYEELQSVGGQPSARNGTDTFKKSWETIMSDPSAAETQHSYAISQYFVPAADKVTKSTGVDVRVKSKTLQDVLWSTAIQHGAGGCNRVFKNAIKGCGNTNPTDDALIVAVYNERARDNGMAYFGRSRSNIRQSVVKRFNNEKLDALKSLELEIKNQTTATQQGTLGEVTLPIGPQ